MIDNAGIVMPMLFEPARHLYKLVTSKWYRTYCWLAFRYGSVPRFTPKEICISGFKLLVPDVASFLSAFREIFVEDIYSFNPENQAPAILDCGANIGLSAIYFKIKYPNSTVIAYEADPNIYEVLKRNIENNKLDGVTLFNKAVWREDGFVSFAADGADGGRIKGGQSGSSVDVSAISLRSILNEHGFDLIKIDIEGAETEVVRSCIPELAKTRNLFIEYHSFSGRNQGLGAMLASLEDIGFRLHIHSHLAQKRPLEGLKNYHGMDMQLNLFFKRNS